MSFTQRIIDRQGDLETIWHNAVVNAPETEAMIVKHKVYDPEEDVTKVTITEFSFLRKGFKIQYTEKTGLYELFHTNTSDYYKYPDDKVINKFVSEGWLNTTDSYQIERDKKRLDKFNRKILQASESRNDSLMVHWRKQRDELINRISLNEEKIVSRQ